MGPAIPHASRERVNAAYQHRSLVLSLAIASYALVFMTFVVFEVPGLGIAHLFYLPVAALALTGGVKRGILAGAIAVALHPRRHHQSQHLAVGAPHAVDAASLPHVRDDGRPARLVLGA
jgi:hypothetical protein